VKSGEGLADVPGVGRTYQHANRDVLIEGDLFPVRLRRSPARKAARLPAEATDRNARPWRPVPAKSEGAPPDVDQVHVRAKFLGNGYGLYGVMGLCCHGDAGLAFENEPEAAADHGLIVGQQAPGSVPA
jgi:hypothetical protein